MHTGIPIKQEQTFKMDKQIMYAQVTSRTTYMHKNPNTTNNAAPVGQNAK